VIEVDSKVRELLDRWALTPATPVVELTADAVRKDDLGVLALQRTPGELQSVEDITIPGPAGTLPVRVYRPGRGRFSAPAPRARRLDARARRHIASTAAPRPVMLGSRWR
jgi:hypothetical protein